MKTMFLRVILFLGLFCAGIEVANAAQPYLRLPYPNGYTYQVTCGYGCGYHTWGNNEYYALDFDTPNDQDIDVLASASGKVITAGWSSSYGNMVEIDHGDGYVTRYGHMKSISVAVNWRVNQGDTIGVDGCTPGLPYCSGDHIHFSVRLNGQSVPPTPMSCYSTFSQGSWYTSDNALFVWNFNNGGLSCSSGKDGWYPSGVSANGVSSGIWILDPAPSDTDPKTYSQPYCCVDPYTYGHYINPTIYRAMEIRIASNAQNRKLKVYFRTTNQNYYSEAKHEEINIPGSGGYYTCIIQMGINGYWYSGGRVTQLRIDPTEYGNPDGSYDNIGIDYIKLSTYSGGSYCQ